MNLQVTFLISSFVITIALAPLVIKALRKFKLGQKERDLGIEEHKLKEGTPTMGGIIMLAVISFVLIIASFKYNILTLPLVAVLGFGLVGFIDDFKKLREKNTKGISAKTKMLLLFIVTIGFILLYMLYFKLGQEMYAPFYSEPIQIPTFIFIIFVGFILLGTSNAINLTDGLDGLSTGVVSVIMMYFTLYAVRTDNTAMIILGSTTVGTCMGFLAFNIKPAKVFMGDTGSLALGGAIAAISIIMKMPMYLIIVAIIPVIETITSAIQIIYFRKTGGKRFFKMAPLHHHLELSGMGENKVVFMFWMITVLACILAYFV